MDSVREQLRDDPGRDPRFFTIAGLPARNDLRLPDHVLQVLRDPIITLNAACQITSCNPAAEKLYGFAASDVHGMSFGEATGCDWPPAPGEVGELREKQNGWSGQLRQHTRDGRALNVEVSIFAVEASADAPAHPAHTAHPAHVVIVHRNAGKEPLEVALEARIRFDAFLAELSTQFSGLLEEDVDAAIESGLKRVVEFLEVDRSCFGEFTADRGFIVTHSYAASEAHRYSHGVADEQWPWIVKELRARRNVVLRRGADDLPEEAVVDRATLSAEGLKAGIAIPLHVGSDLCCVLSVSAFRGYREWSEDLQHGLTVAGEIFANAVARRQAKERLQHKQHELTHLGRVAAVSELASVIAHELDQPLTAIMTNAHAMRNLLNCATPDTEELLHAADDIVADAARASQIVKRERRLLRKGQGNIEADDLNDVLREIDIFLRADARQHRCQTTIELAPEPLPIRADRVQLQQVLLNLARNSIQAMEAQPSELRALHIRTEVAGEEVVLRVQDSGPPIDDANLKRMFDAFYTSKADGLGMGLTISRSIVQAHQGRMWATRNSDAGLTLHIALPRQSEA